MGRGYGQQACLVSMRVLGEKGMRNWTFSNLAEKVCCQQGAEAKELTVTVSSIIENADCNSQVRISRSVTPAELTKAMKAAGESREQSPTQQNRLMHVTRNE